MLRWGVLGAGLAAGRVFAPAARAAGHDLAVVASRSLTHAQSFAAAHGARRARGDYEEVLAAEDVDAVYVALPNALHERWAVAALGAGKHVLVASPAAVDADAAGRMAAAAGAGGLVLAEAAAWRWHPRGAALADLVATRAGGRLRSIAVVRSRPLADPPGERGGFRSRVDQGGGALSDLGTQAVAAARWLAGEEPDAVAGVAQRRRDGTDTTTTAVLRFPGGASATVVASHEAAAHDVVEVLCADAVFALPRAFSAVRGDDAVILRDGEVTARFDADPHEAMLAGFEAAVLGTRAQVPGADDIVATATVCDRIRASAAG